MARIELRSPAFEDQAFIAARHARDGENISPALEWTGVPANAAELVLVCDDPDAPRGPFLHWLVTGVDPHIGGVPEGQAPTGGREWPNDFGHSGWGGPEPPVGDRPHRYVFTVYALSEPAGLPATPTADDVRRATEAVALAQGSLVGRYQR